jgi:hypothetical protein
MSIQLIITISSSGCFSTEDSWHIWYNADYGEELNFSSIMEIFDRENISYNLKDNDTLSFKFGKGVNNESIERTSGGMVNAPDVDYYRIVISLDDEEKFPLEGSRSDLDYQKPILKDSMDYITNLVHEATGMWPISKKFSSSQQYA